MSKFSDLADKSEQNPSLSSSCFPNLDIPSSKFEPVQKSKKNFLKYFIKRKLYILAKKTNLKTFNINAFIAIIYMIV